MLQAEIITIGDELLIGQVVDTNSAYMAQKLNEWGISLYRVTSVHDDAPQIREALSKAIQEVDIVLLTGGLGPTKDDITKNTLADFFSSHLIYNKDIRAHLEQLYASRPEVLNRLTDTQCLFPDNATLIHNGVGSAQVMMWQKDGRAIISMPGVPYEMEWVMQHGVGAVLKQLASVSVGCTTITHRTIQVTGIPESSLALLIQEWEDALPNTMHLAYLPKDGVIRLRLSAYGDDPILVDEQLTQLLQILRSKEAPLSEPEGMHVIATEDIPIEVLVGRLLTQKDMKVSSAESCTGGKIAHLLNKHPGSSAFYWGSVVAYDNSVKQNVLGVSSADLRQYGAVSEPVVRQMAEGVCRVMHTDYAIATSGIAGPDGGTAEKPVGTVWIAIATPCGTYAHCFHLGKLREQITDRATTKALIWLSMLLQSSEN